MVDVLSAHIAILLWFAAVTMSSVAPQPLTPGTTSQQNLNQPVASEAWYAPDVYDRDSPGITMPELVKETKPNYLGEAMRARIEGIVGLECIIEKDGTVGPVRVRHSLDSAKGLDDEAIRTVRQWRFNPGKKNGIPVRMRVPIEISFWLRGSPYQAEVGWPKDFELPRSKPETSNDRLAEDVLAHANVQIRMKYPRDWAVVKGSTGELMRMDSREARGCTLLTPKSSEMDLMEPLRKEALHAFEKSTRSEMTKEPSNVELTGVGQVSAGHLWIWSEMSRRGLDPSTAASANAERLQSAYEGMRIWKFTTTDSHHELSVVCYVLVPRNSSKDDMKRTMQRASEDFAGVLNGITVRPR